MTGPISFMPHFKWQHQKAVTLQYYTRCRCTPTHKVTNQHTHKIVMALISVYYTVHAKYSTCIILVCKTKASSPRVPLTYGPVNKTWHYMKWVYWYYSTCMILSDNNCTVNRNQFILHQSTFIHHMIVQYTPQIISGGVNNFVWMRWEEQALHWLTDWHMEEELYIHHINILHSYTWCG